MYKQEKGYVMNERLTSQGAYLFQAALGIQSPWYITNITLNQEKHELHIYLDFEKRKSIFLSTMQFDL
jgi:hypothetical protein